MQYAPHRSISHGLAGKSCSKERAMVFDDQRPCWRAIASRYSMPTAEFWRGRPLPGRRSIPRPIAIRSATLLICDREYPVTSMMSRVCRPAKRRSLIVSRRDNWFRPAKASAMVEVETSQNHTRPTTKELTQPFVLDIQIFKTARLARWRGFAHLYTAAQSSLIFRYPMIGTVF